jgi:hypothetical protein
VRGKAGVVSDVWRADNVEAPLACKHSRPVRDSGDPFRTAPIMKSSDTRRVRCQMYSVRTTWRLRLRAYAPPLFSNND